ncbi:MAG: cytidine deaminase [Flavobacteriales bacterium]|nr:cytidine deaminase [Flavobacteriales bacterium]MCB9167457.1 cytidine deaminase [Flavobacteriales bacterium]
MAAEQRIEILHHRHGSWDDLPATDRDLLEHAVAAAARAYAPYSHFHVGAALLTSDGRIVEGSNQENASFPAGICAERTALHAAMSDRPEAHITAIAVAVPQAGPDRPVAPCGICRQALLEQERRQAAPIRLLMGAVNGPVIEMRSVADLLPFSFDGSFLER